MCRIEGPLASIGPALLRTQYRGYLVCQQAGEARMAARKHGPYWHQQKALGAEFADRIGFDAAERYTTTEAAHLATRPAPGLYDLSNPVLVEARDRHAMTLPRPI